MKLPGHRFAIIPLAALSLLATAVIPLTAFEAHVINVTAKIDPGGQEVQVTTHVHDQDHNDVTEQVVAYGTIIHDKVIVSGTGPVPSGTVTFKIFSSNDSCDCTGTPISTEANVPLVNGQAESTPWKPAPGNYGYLVSYSGGGPYLSADGICERFTVRAGDTTRTLGFWQTHTAFTSQVFSDNFTAGMTVGSGGHTRLITNIQSTDQSILFGAYYSSIPKKSDGTNRNAVERARIRLLQHLVTAKLNCAAFGCSLLTQDKITNADAAYAGTSTATMLLYQTQLDIYNNSGDGQPIPPSLGDPGPATPATSQDWANLVFWDTP